MEVRKLVANAKKVALKVRVNDDGSGPSIAGLDPRVAFAAVLNDGTVSLNLSVPDFDRGWARSKPNKGRYKWKGKMNGIRRIRVFDRVARRGFMKVVVIAADVQAAAALATAATTTEVDIDGTCVSQ